MNANNNKLARVLAWSNIGLGVTLFGGYGFYLVMRAAFMTPGNTDPGLVLYALATAGCAFVAWGLMMRGLDASGISRAVVMKSSAAGFGLLGLMRFGTALFPHAPFDQMIALPIAESCVFLLLALGLFRSA